MKKTCEYCDNSDFRGHPDMRSSPCKGMSFMVENKNYRGGIRVAHPQVSREETCHLWFNEEHNKLMIAQHNKLKQTICQ